MIFARWIKYGIYSRFNFRVPLGERGDVFDRYMVRILEMRESLKILDQALRDIPAGPIIDPKAKLRNLRPKPGEAYGRIEGAQRRTGFLSHQRRRPNALSLPRPPAESHQPDRPRRHVPGPYHRGRRRHSGQHRYCARGGGSLMLGARHHSRALIETARNFCGSYHDPQRLTTVQYPGREAAARRKTRARFLSGL